MVIAFPNVAAQRRMPRSERTAWGGGGDSGSSAPPPVSPVIRLPVSGEGGARAELEVLADVAPVVRNAQGLR